MGEIIRSVPLGDSRERLTSPARANADCAHAKFIAGWVAGHGGRMPPCRRAMISLVVLCVAMAVPPAMAAELTMLHRDMPNLGDGASAAMAGGFTAAPTPDNDISAPPAVGVAAGARWEPDVAPDQYPVVHPGSGWLPDSAFTDDRSRRHSINPLGITPTFNLKVPLN
jgi:hypothetical protein